MMMANKEYMIGHMKEMDGTMNVRNIVLSAACEASELLVSMIQSSLNLSDWRRFISRLQLLADAEEYENIHAICQTVFSMHNIHGELEGLYLAREDNEVCKLYYRVFVGMLDLSLFSAEAMYELMGGDYCE
jgi:hypothetical protein